MLNVKLLKFNKFFRSCLGIEKLKENMRKEKEKNKIDLKLINFIQTHHIYFISLIFFLLVISNFLSYFSS